MERFVYQKLIEWKNRDARKPLVLNGARQVGKTWLLHEFDSNQPVIPVDFRKKVTLEINSDRRCFSYRIVIQRFNIGIFHNN